MSTRDAAMAAARRGWAVFPTRPGGKEPREGLSWPSVATADLDRLARPRVKRLAGLGLPDSESTKRWQGEATAGLQLVDDRIDQVGGRTVRGDARALQRILENRSDKGLTHNRFPEI